MRLNSSEEYQEIKSRDMFQRFKQVESLYQIIRNSESNFVSALDSPYGTGKSTFLDMLQGYIEYEMTDKIITVHYNAWENDFFPDPLISLVGCFENAIKNTSKVKASDFKAILGQISSNVTSLFTGSIVNPKELKELCEEDNDRQLIAKYFDIVSDRLRLLKLFEQLSKIGEDDKEMKIVFLVDELDRCNPTFAIKLLEAIKFFFNVPNYYFILAVHKDHLYSTIKCLYGNEIDAMGYLRRFIDFDIVLNSYSTNQYIDFKFSDYTNYHSEYKHLIVMYKVLCKNMKLRDIDKLHLATSLALPKSWININSTSFSNGDNPANLTFELYLIAFGVFIKMIDANLYSAVFTPEYIGGKERELSNLLDHDSIIEFSDKGHASIYYFMQNFNCTIKALHQKQFNNVRITYHNNYTYAIVFLLDSDIYKFTAFDYIKLLGSIDIE